MVTSCGSASLKANVHKVVVFSAGGYRKLGAGHYSPLVTTIEFNGGTAVCPP
jgi:hypothetical protein